ncbi:MAG: hypothetical protein KAJ51_17160, partial [Thermoplasmata archaeon]|nr:hypothetical protein [Thermoplasmata archaeon]
LIENKFKTHPNYYKMYKEDSKLIIAFSDMAMGVTPVGWDIYFVEIHDKISPTKRQLLYAKLCKNKDQLFEMLEDGRETFVKPPPQEPREYTKLKVNIKQLIKERMKTHPKFERILEGYKKLFVIFKDILIIVEDIGGTFYNWELFKREGKIMVIHKNAGAKVGFDKIVDQVVELREECDKKPIAS